MKKIMETITCCRDCWNCLIETLPISRTYCAKTNLDIVNINIIPEWCVLENYVEKKQIFRRYSKRISILKNKE